MDICNRLSPKRFAHADDFLTFISIYEDKQREAAYKRLLRDQRALIEGRVCVEAGCGMGMMSRELVRLGAKKVYAVEVNNLMADLVAERLADQPRIEVVKADITDFDPDEKIDLLVHEFYGQLLLDEELYLLERLCFRPRHVLPDGGKLCGGIIALARMHDPLITPDILRRLDGILVSGLFDEGRLDLQFHVMEWNYGKKISWNTACRIPPRPGDLLYFGVKVLHQGREICCAGRCPNWSFVWTYRSSNRFSLDFVRTRRAPEPVFRWLD